LPPIVTDDSGDIMMFPTVEAAEQYVEAIDVRDGVYALFDSTGTRLTATTDGNSVRISLDPGGTTIPEELAARLRRFVLQVGPERIGIENPTSTELPALIDALEPFLISP
jgi:hypothetical protein